MMMGRGSTGPIEGEGMAKFTPKSRFTTGIRTKNTVHENQWVKVQRELDSRLLPTANFLESRLWG